MLLLLHLGLFLFSSLVSVTSTILDYHLLSLSVLLPAVEPKGTCIGEVLNASFLSPMSALGKGHGPDESFPFVCIKNLKQKETDQMPN